MRSGSPNRYNGMELQNPARRLYFNWKSEGVVCGPPQNLGSAEKPEHLSHQSPLRPAFRGSSDAAWRSRVLTIELQPYL